MQYFRNKIYLIDFRIKQNIHIWEATFWNQGLFLTANLTTNNDLCCIDVFYPINWSRPGASLHRWDIQSCRSPRRPLGNNSCWNYTSCKEHDTDVYLKLEVTLLCLTIFLMSILTGNGASRNFASRQNRPPYPSHDIRGIYVNCFNWTRMLHVLERVNARMELAASSMSHAIHFSVFNGVWTGSVGCNGRTSSG